MIIPGLFLCITSFVAGVILTWLFFAWRMDKESTVFRERLYSIMDTRDALYGKNEGLSIRLKEWKETAAKQGVCITSLTEELLKYKPQEKEHGNPKD